MITPEGTEATEVRITLQPSGRTIHARLVFRDPEPAAGAPADIWEAQAGQFRGYGTSALEAAAAAMNHANAPTRRPGP